MKKWIGSTMVLGSMATLAFGQAPPEKVAEDVAKEVAKEIRVRVNGDAALGQDIQIIVEGAVEDALRSQRRPLNVQVQPAPVPPGVPVPLNFNVEIKKEKVTWLGVNIGRLSPPVREQLKLPRGVGLLVTGADPKGPADSAGIKPNDVLEKLDDQLIINHEQLSALIGARKPGDEVTLSIIRENKPQTLKAKLVEKEVPVGGDPMGFAHWEVAVPPMAAANGDVLFLAGGPGVGGGAGGVGMMAPGRMIVKNFDGKMTTQWADAEHTITVERAGDKVNRVIVKDSKADKVVFDGPVENAEKELPKELVDKLKKAQEATRQGEMFQLHVPAPFGAARGKVMTWQGDEQIFFLRVMGKTPTYLLALSRKDGRVLFDGPTMTDEQRKAIPAEVAEQFEMLASKPEMAKEFGAVEKK